jgi:hypothetical protein
MVYLHCYQRMRTIKYWFFQSKDFICEPEPSQNLKISQDHETYIAYLGGHRGLLNGLFLSFKISAPLCCFLYAGFFWRDQHFLFWMFIFNFSSHCISFFFALYFKLTLLDMYRFIILMPAYEQSVFIILQWLPQFLLLFLSLFYF